MTRFDQCVRGRRLFVAGTAAIAIAIAATASGARAQTNFNDLFNEGADLMIQQSLGSFGSSLGGRVPVLIDHKSAFTTVRSLPGKPFAPRAVPQIAAALRASKDGTAPLPAGDYAFPVDVFCMRANAESPNGYQYRIAPLRGSAADIITVLNARAPSYAIGHGVLQVLSWNIQAGTPYAGMAPAERAAVDKLIPEFRNRFKGETYSAAAAKYAHLAQTIPGMPRLEEALRRIGPIGSAMSNLNTLHRQLAAHPQEFDQLSRVLVPLAGTTGSVAAPTAASRATPWSRYSDRVYARFVTSGNFTTPGTYQVRVLGGPSAPVPFTNIVADSGTDAVQSLALAVRASAPASKPAPPRPRAKPPEPKIISETYVPVPETLRSRTTVGVGELVKLTFSGGQANWELDSHSMNPVEKLDEGHLTFQHGSETTYVAASDKRTETITAEGAGHAKATITFNVIAPTGVKQVVDPAMPLIHTFDVPNIGYWAESYLEPDNVSFQYVGVREGDVCPAATGVFAPPANELLYGHNPSLAPQPVVAVIHGLGSLLKGHDTNYSGTTGGPGMGIPLGHPAYAPGYKSYHIPWYYVVTSGGPEHRFAFIDGRFELAADGSTLTASKAGATVTTTVLHPTVGTPPTVGSSGPTKTVSCP